MIEIPPIPWWYPWCKWIGLILATSSLLTEAGFFIDNLIDDSFSAPTPWWPLGVGAIGVLFTIPPVISSGRRLEISRQNMLESKAVFDANVKDILDRHQPGLHGLCGSCGEPWPCGAHSQILLVQKFVERLDTTLLDQQRSRWLRRRPQSG